MSHCHSPYHLYGIVIVLTAESALNSPCPRMVLVPWVAAKVQAERVSNLLE